MTLLFIKSRSSTGAEGAFAPVNFQQQVHFTRPESGRSEKDGFFGTEGIHNNGATGIGSI